MVKRILDIVDMQNDFMQPTGALYVPGAEKIIPRAKSFLKNLKAGDFDLALVKYDTHFTESYDKNPESKQFPPHCVYGTWGWDLSFKVPVKTARAIPFYQMDKNVFDMWARKPSLKKLSFSDVFNKKAYKNLFRVGQMENPSVNVAREKFFKQMDIGPDTEVVMMGVASDYCVHDAILGYLKRGCRVIVMQDMVQGIGTDVPGRAASGKIEDVLKLADFAPYVASGKLSLSTSEQILKTIRQEKNNGCKSKNCRCPAQPNRR